MAVNKVIYGGRTLIDLTGVTVTADKLLEGYTALDKSGTLITGTASPSSGSVIAVEDIADSHGGTVRSITAVSLEGDTVSPSVLASGYTAHNAAGEPITGTMVPGITPSGTIELTTNGTHDVTNYASAYVNVQSQGVNLQTKTDISPTESSQTITPDSGYDGLTSVQINAIPSNYIGSGVTRKAAATITPGTSDQTIASGTYLTGTQTIAGDADLVGNNILSGVSIFGVAGTVAFQTYYTGSSAPSSSLGSDGDIYLQTT